MSLRVGIIGAGAFARFTLGAYAAHLPDLQLVAIASRTRSRAEGLASDFGIGRVEESNAQLLAASDIDAVVILTPPQTHVDITSEALKSGKHVLVDKPVAFTTAEIDHLVNVAAENDRLITTNLVLRTHRFHQRIREMVASKEMGSLLQIITSAQLARYPENHWYWDPEISGGFFLNTFSHFLDLYDFITGEPPSFLRSHGNPTNGYTLVSGYGSGVNATLSASLQVSNENERVRTDYIFERGTVATKGWMPERLLINPENAESEEDTVADRNADYQTCLAAILQDLMDRVQDPGRTSTTGITMEVIRDSVVIPRRAEEQNMA